jgi:hypothetical protein
MRSALFWDITQRTVVILHQSFGTAYQSHLQGARSTRRLLDPWRWDRYVVPKRRYRIATLRCVISQKSTYLTYIAAEAWNHALSLYWLIYLSRRRVFQVPRVEFPPRNEAGGHPVWEVMIKRFEMSDSHSMSISIAVFWGVTLRKQFFREVLRV